MSFSFIKKALHSNLRLRTEPEKNKILQSLIKTHLGALKAIFAVLDKKLFILEPKV